MAHVVCPRDHGDLRHANDRLICAAGHAYPVVDGVPVMLLDDVTQTMGIAEASIARAKSEGVDEDPLAHLYIDTLGISDEEKRGLRALASKGDSVIDPVVSFLVGATSGLTYKHLIGTLASYPIPVLRLPETRGARLLDIGCNWGRWSIAAARKGYDVVGIDPSLGGIMAARRVSRSLGLAIRFIVGDARWLPFRADAFDAAFSYSVIQHLSRDDARMVLAQIGRTLRPGGTSLVQMPTRFGIRSLYHQARRGFRDGLMFEVRYWSISRLREAFSRAIGPSTLSVDCYFGIGLQKADAALMTPLLRVVVETSEALRQISRVVPVLTYVADSVYIRSTKPLASRT
jgi:SAM-dependent methyltransferase/uncharacterized protein YbaR (Trm112 family)